ncbi:MAG: cytochrome c biogenesis protein CcdA [Candidatus Caldatribacteriota bacterium]|jgi:cytochrome c-type biogenesis protein|nr:cytochrome c biogenesis protein CcdA [Atribacterota bacterium]MDD3030961.1 cytochrome c biogenesis protein CcdA [Atribacterota bacterium]MDD3641107.1 cytochrome c biogenesis protein CcdA [Atribacterota bacterium]MDD4289128.1 cytochrome c biogenesis protein CcdA [Atribacterota bacterium]MDD4764401.1 cytochrome c biogenesis protein CcdA [Atribacterota bacterium]
MLAIQEVSYLAAFIAGLLSFLSPCILPLVPGYMSFISGLSLEQLTDKDKRNDKSFYRVLTGALFFILGFSLVFILLGASATLIGQLLQKYSVLFKRIGGILIIIFGLHMLGIINIQFLNFQKKYQRSKDLQFNLFLTPFLLGFAFAFGWTPCIGPILAAILVYASTQDTILKGVTLLSVYSLGLAIPFLVTAIAVNQFFRFSKNIKKYFRIIELVGGLLLVIIGIMIFSDNLAILRV